MCRHKHTHVNTYHAHLQPSFDEFEQIQIERAISASRKDVGTVHYIPSHESSPEPPPYSPLTPEVYVLHF